ncbi:MAG: AI-2E family transporter [Acidobacteria bacterium]|nr:AI-2E family transporter [Acidobacteriota bacterium]
MPSPATFPERAAWILMGLGLLFALVFHLVPGLLAGLLLFSLLHKLDGLLQKGRMASEGNARLRALALLVLVALGLAGAAALGLSALWKIRTTALPELLARMAQTLDSTRSWLGGRYIPEELADADTLREALSGFLKSHAAEFKAAGGQAGKALAHILAGVALGVLGAFHHKDPEGPRPLAAALAGRLERFRSAFEAIVFAQVKISLVNTLLTAAYLYGVLPLFGVHLPLRFTLVLVTFFAGLLPVLGNVLSNTAVVLISLGSGPGVAAASLAFLVLVHKLEYFVNAKIVGSRIHAQAWEVLGSMILMEIAFGTPGIVLAPILYAYAKGELRERGWV